EPGSVRLNETVPLAGAVIAEVQTLRDRHTVIAPHGGRVIEWLVTDGDPVSPGQPLLRLHPQV
ncbi:MAG TPA: biotin/lipoyl-binding protein, partial [Candidatus Lustribacter sp.]|nr:biotin/lipoyl-binding protein [Candidatus Lustribacter sp.]